MNNQGGELMKQPVLFDESGDGMCCVWVAADVRRLVIVSADRCVVVHRTYNGIDREVLLLGQAIESKPLRQR